MSQTLTRRDVHTEADGPLIPVELQEALRPEPRELGPAWTKHYKRYVKLIAKRDEIIEELEMLKEQFRSGLGRGRFTVGGEPVLDVMATRRFSESLAREILPPELIREIEVTVLDASRLREPWRRICQEEHGKDSVRRVQRAEKG